MKGVYGSLGLDMVKARGAILAKMCTFGRILSAR